MKVLMEFVNTENESKDHYMELIFSCLENQEQSSSQFQWWLGRLIYMKRLFDEHPSILFSTDRRLILNFSLAVSPNVETDLNEFLNSLEENNASSVIFHETTRSRLQKLVQFCVAAVSSAHKSVHKCALYLLVKCISVASLDQRVFPKIKELIHGLKPTIKSTLHRHLSFESQREQADILNILDEHEDFDGKQKKNFFCELSRIKTNFTFEDLVVVSHHFIQFRHVNS